MAAFQLLIYCSCISLCCCVSIVFAVYNLYYVLTVAYNKYILKLLKAYQSSISKSRLIFSGAFKLHLATVHRSCDLVSQNRAV